MKENQIVFFVSNNFLKKAIQQKIQEKLIKDKNRTDNRKSNLKKTKEIELSNSFL